MRRAREAPGRLRAWQRAIAPLGGTRLGAWYFASVARRVDPRLLRASRGRLTSVGPAPVLRLATVGARSGERRTTPLLYLRRGDDLVVVASNFGRERHPAWFHNLVREPRAEVLVGGRMLRCRARVAEGDERAELWRRATELYAGYRGYQRRADRRQLPIVILEPCGEP